MKLIVEKQGEFVKAIKIEYTPAEALIINHAMRRYACDEEVNATDREIMEQMLEVEPIFTDFEYKAEIVISQLRADRDRLQEAIDKIRVEIEHLRNFRAENYDLEQYCDSFDARIIFMEDVLQVIDKYKAEKEKNNG